MALAKILIVDDDPSIQNLIQRVNKTIMLEVYPETVRLPSLCLLNHLLILDINLPDVDLLPKDAKPHQVFCSNSTAKRADQADKIQGLSRKVLTTISRKPFSLGELEVSQGAIF